MDILLISNEDSCRTRIAQELLYSFGKGMKITTAGIAEAGAVPAEVSSVMSQKGYEVSRKKPSSVSVHAASHWDFVITLCEEAEDELKSLPLDAEHVAHFHFEDALADASVDEYEREAQISALYEDMYHTLYEFYRDVLSEFLLPRCTCGANDYCRCE